MRAANYFCAFPRLRPQPRAGIAQLVEQLICNQKVVSSILTVGTIHFAWSGKAGSEGTLLLLRHLRLFPFAMRTLAVAVLLRQDGRAACLLAVR